MKRPEKRKKKENAASGRIWLLLASAFLAGAVGGSLLWRTGISGQFAQLLEVKEGFLPFFLRESVLLAMIFLGGFTRMGGLCAVFSLGAEGLFLGWEVTLCAVESDAKSYLFSMAVRFLPAFLTLSALILLGRQAALLQYPRRTRPDSAYFLTAAIGLTAILLAALLYSLSA